jgi:hypothetical protein
VSKSRLPPPRPAPAQTPPTLDYRQPVPTPASSVRFGRKMTLLLTANTLLGGAMVLSIVYADRLGHATWLMIAAGALMIYTTMGCLTRDVPRFQLALALATVTLVLAAVTTVMNYTAAAQLEALILSRFTTPGSVVRLRLDSGRGGDLATLWLAWKVCAVAALMNLALVAYLAVRLGVATQARQRNA